MREPDRGDVDLILRLYELRRETEMRKARRFLGEFEPKSVEDVKALADWEHPENAHFRQVMSYWGMVADFTVRGLLHPEMFAAHCGEALFIWSKFEPFLPELRAQVSPTFLVNIENAIKSHPAVEQKAAMARRMREREAAEAAKAPAAAPARRKPAKKRR
jgi:hypothetical protein